MHFECGRNAVGMRFECTSIRVNKDLQLKSKDEEATALQERIETIQSNEKKLKMQVEEVTRRELSQQRENSDLNLRWEQRWEEERSRESAKHGELTAVLQKQRDHLGREKKDLEESSTVTYLA